MKFLKNAWNRVADDLAQAIAQLRASTHDVWTF